MNFVYISPQFPKIYCQFCARLQSNGVRVLAIGDTPYDQLSETLKNALTEYYRVDNLENYDEVVKAMGYFIFEYGRIDWLESNNEYWLEQDARLRTDFNIPTGLHVEDLETFKLKSGMKAYYQQAGVPCARYHLVSTYEQGKQFVEEVGYPVIVKPDNGVGASSTYKLNHDDELRNFYEHHDPVSYIMEEFIDGVIVSYDGIADQQRQVLFETSHVFCSSIMDVVNQQGHLAYYSLKEIPAQLKERGQALVKAFKTNGRCFHIEFFKLNQDKPGLGKKGDYVGLEINMRMPGAYTPEMMNYANDIDVYQIYADMVCYNKAFYDPTQRPYSCVYASRRDGHSYQHSHQEILERYRDQLVMVDRMPDILAGAMGNDFYKARFKEYTDVQDFIRFVQE